MDIMGLSKEVQHNIFSLLAGILHLGNVLFGDKNNYATVLSERGMFFSYLLQCILINL
jgi:myosin heavy subunit